MDRERRGEKGKWIGKDGEIDKEKEGVNIKRKT